MIAGTGRCVGFVENPWEMEGRKGVSRTVTLADGGSTFKVKLHDDVWNMLSAEERSRLLSPESIFDLRLTCRLDPPARAREGREIVMEARDPKAFELRIWEPGVEFQVVAAGASNKAPKAA